MKLKGKHIVVTGGASGIGRELVRQLCPDNEITVLARPSKNLLNLQKAHDHVHVIETDFSDLSSVETAADKLVKSGVTVDLLINNAAVQYTPHFTEKEFRYETIKREININFTSICTLIYLVLPLLLQSDRASIININSGLALAPKTGSAIYCATKAALNSLSLSLRYQLENTNIIVQQAFLPLVDTPMTKGRGTGKITAEEAAREIIAGIAASKIEINIGKVKLLRFIQRVSPTLARQIMKRG